MKNESKKHTYITVNKAGISLIVLILTIVVALILVATVVISTTVSIDNANVTTFAKDVTEIQEATESYYITNGVMPSFTDDSNAKNKDAILALARNSSILQDELNLNNDSSSTFYTIDLAKINVTKAAYGNKERGTNDIFVISYPTMNAYYLLGLDAKGTTYFSVSSRISDVTKISQNTTDTSTTTVISSGGVKVTKTNGWSNKMGVTIEADMAADEVLYMSVSGFTNRVITTTTGKNTFGFNLLSSIVSNAETIKVPTLTPEEANFIETPTKSLEYRYVDILKYKGTDLVGKVRIDLTNFSKTLPTISSAVLSSYSNMNAVKLSLSSSTSGISEVRYEYLTKYTEDGAIDNYYSGVTDFDAVYMKGKAKKANLANDLTTTINAPKEVRSIKVAVIDKAGNINLYNQQIAPNLYIGSTVDTSEKGYLQVTARMFSTNGIKSISFFKSIDGINFTDEQAYTLNTTTNGVTLKQNFPYSGFVSNVAYIKMVAVNYDGTLTETKIIKTNLLETVSLYAGGMTFNTTTNYGSISINRAPTALPENLSQQINAVFSYGSSNYIGVSTRLAEYQSTTMVWPSQLVFVVGTSSYKKTYAYVFSDCYPTLVNPVVLNGVRCSQTQPTYIRMGWAEYIVINEGTSNEITYVNYVTSTDVQNTLTSEISKFGTYANIVNDANTSGLARLGAYINATIQ